MFFKVKNRRLFKENKGADKETHNIVNNGIILVSEEVSTMGWLAD